MSYVWVSCSKETNPAFYVKAHVIPSHQLKADWQDTLCGATGTGESFRRDNRKPKCQECANKLAAKALNHAASAKH